MGVSQYPFPVFPVFTFLCNFPDIYFRIEICGERFSMITCVAINDIKVMHLIKMMFCGIGSVNGCYTRIKTAPKNCSDPGFLEPVNISPLPSICIFCLLRRLIVSRIEISDTSFQTGIHYVKVLVGQSNIYNDIRFKRIYEFYQLRNLISVNLSSCNIVLPNFAGYSIAL